MHRFSGLITSYASEKKPHSVLFPSGPDVALAPYKEHLAEVVRLIVCLTPLVQQIGMLITSYYRSPFSFSPQEARRLCDELVDLKWVDNRIVFLKKQGSQKVSLNVEDGSSVCVDTFSEQLPVLLVERTPFSLTKVRRHRSYFLNDSTVVAVTLGSAPGKISKNSQVALQTEDYESFEECCVSTDATRLVAFKNSTCGSQLQILQLPSVTAVAIFESEVLERLQERPLEVRASFCTAETLVYTLQDCDLKVAVFWDVQNWVPIAAHLLDAYTRPDGLVASESGNLFVLGTSETEEAASRLHLYPFSPLPNRVN